MGNRRVKENKERSTNLKKAIMSAIQKRIIKELYRGTTLSVRNMYLLRVSNLSRELRRQLEIPFNIQLNRKTITWSDEFSSGFYYEYSLNPNDFTKLKEIYIKIVLGIE